MPQYGQSPWAQAGDAMSNAGQSMGNVFLATQQGRLKAQQFMAQQALEQQYLQLARQKALQERMVNEARAKDYEGNTALQKQQMDLARQTAERSQMIGRLRSFQGAPNPMAMVSDPYNGPQIMGDLRSAGTIPQGRTDLTQGQLMQAVMAALQGQGMQQAMSTPASAERANEPIVMSPQQTAFDPYSQRPIPGMQTGMGPYQQGMLDNDRQQTIDRRLYQEALEGNQRERMAVADRHNREMADIAKKRLDKPVDPMEELVRAAQVVHNTAGPMGTLQDSPQYQSATNIFNKVAGSVPSAGQNDAESFDSEAIARAAGKKAGDRIRIKGVGLVELTD